MATCFIFSMVSTIQSYVGVLVGFDLVERFIAGNTKPPECCYGCVAIAAVPYRQFRIQTIDGITGHNDGIG